ncbi:hypothetical protein Tco_1218560 [Tanacetum coccineum]
MGCGEEIEEMLEINLVEMGGDQDIFSFEAWRHAFDINESIYVELCHEFYSTYEFNELVQDDELWSKVGEEGFKTYFNGGLCSDEHFSAREHWLRISKEGDLHLSRSTKEQHAVVEYVRGKNQDEYANVAWMITKWMKKKGVGSQRESMICCGQFITHMARRMNLLSEEVLIGLSAPTHYRALDKITLRELIGPNGKLITEAPMPGAPRVAMPIPLCPSMHVGVFEHMAGVYDIPLQGAYNPPGYDQQ